MGRFNKRIAALGKSRIALRVEAAGAGMARIYKHISQGPFAILSACKGADPEVDAKNMAELMASGSGFLPTAGVFKGIPEDSMLLPGASKEQALALGKKYNQEMVIWGDEGTMYLLNQDGSVANSWPVAESFHYLGKGEESEPSDNYTETEKGHKFEFREPKTALWTYRGVPLQPEEVRAALSVKGKFAFSLGPAMDFEAEGVPFFYIAAGQSYYTPKFGYAIHAPTTPAEPFLHIKVKGSGFWKMEKKDLAAYLPCKRVA